VLNPGPAREDFARRIKCDARRTAYSLDERVTAASHSYFLAATRLIENYAIWPSV